MTSAGIACSACSQPLPPECWTREGGQHCPSCKAPVLVKAFPALTQPKAGSVPQPVSADTEASCFYHAQNRARAHCDDCGRFLCDLCMLEVPGRTVCPACFGTSIRGRKIQDFETERTMHDSVALALATVPVLLFWPVLITAPLTLFWVIRHWNSPRSILPRSRIRFYLAGFFAMSEIALMVIAVIAVLMVRR